MHILTNIFKTRDEKIRELQEKIAARDEAQQAYNLAKKLTLSLPGVIAAAEREYSIPVFAQWGSEEDALPQEFLATHGGIAALKRLNSDLPEIVAYWEERLRSLMGQQ